ncbi:hypothetical protein VCHA43P277_60224 [Vibrio chagasii]|nr:hypothetical protein VCHA43P277_60224 [Vibrio chagasii]CAH7481068.1 hypothetical protein VCHA50P420_70224 [Vibrio chagasii]
MVHERSSWIASLVTLITLNSGESVSEAWFVKCGSGFRN